MLASDQRCPYFEESVLPMEKRSPKDWPNPKKWPTFGTYEAFQKAAQLYRLTPEIVAVQSTDRKCPDCGKIFLKPRERCCAGCRVKRRRVTNATNQRNWQKARAHPNTVNENGSSLVADSRGSIRKSAVIHQATPFSTLNCITSVKSERRAQL